MLIAIHPIKPAPRACLRARVSELWLVPLMDQKRGLDVGFPHVGNPIITIIVPLTIATADPVMLAFDKIEIPANDC